MVMSVLFTLLGALVVGMSIPLLGGRVPPNAAFGLRTPATLGNKEVWYAANKRAAKGGLVNGLAVMALAAGLPLAGIPQHVALACAATLVVGGVITAVDGWRYAARLLEEKKKPGTTTTE
jgi:uncharacterized membrane protein